MSILVVPDDDPGKEFLAEDIREAHRICRERGYQSFDIWTTPCKNEVMLFHVEDANGQFVGLVGDHWLDENELPPGFTTKPGIVDDGSTMVRSDIPVLQEAT